MRYLMIITLTLWIGCSAAMKGHKTNSKMPSDAAVKCIQGILDRESTLGSNEGYNMEIEFEEPAIECWGELSMMGKQIYTSLLAEVAMAEGSYPVLERTCSWVLKENPTSSTGQKCKLLVESGLKTID